MSGNRGAKHICRLVPAFIIAMSVAFVGNCLIRYFTVVLASGKDEIPIGIRSISFSSDGSHLAFCNGSSEFVVLEVSDKRATRVGILAADDRCHSLAYSPFDDLLLAMSSNGKISVYDTIHREIGSSICPEEPTLAISGPAFSRDGTCFAIAAKHYVQIYRTKDYALHRTINCLGSAIIGTAIDGDARYIAIAHLNRIDLFDLRDGSLTMSFGDILGIVNCVSFTPDGSVLACGTDDGAVVFWKCSSGETVARIQCSTVYINALCFQPNHKDFLVVGDENGHIGVWNWARQENVTCINPSLGSGVAALSFSTRGDLLACGGRDDVIYLWDTRTWRCIYTYKMSH